MAESAERGVVDADFLSPLGIYDSVKQRQFNTSLIQSFLSCPRRRWEQELGCWIVLPVPVTCERPVLYSVAIHAPMRACVVLADVPSLRTTTLFAVALLLCSDWLARKACQPLCIHTSGFAASRYEKLGLTAYCQLHAVGRCDAHEFFRQAVFPFDVGVRPVKPELVSCTIHVAEGFLVGVGKLSSALDS